MDKRLFEAAYIGDVDYLLAVIKDNAFILDSVYLYGSDTPLHVACMAGQSNFVREILNLKQEYAREVNQDGFSPLHIAAAKGHVEIVRELLKVGHELCLLKGREMRIPLHYAAMKGRVQVMEELISACGESVEQVTVRGETALHLAVKNSRFEAFVLLVEHLTRSGKEHVLNMKDSHGNTILHLAVALKLYEVIEFMLKGNAINKDSIELNAVNEQGLTALDVLSLFQSEAGDKEINETLMKAGARSATSFHPLGTTEMLDRENHNNPSNGQNTTRIPTIWLNRFLKFFKAIDDRNRWLQYFKFKKERDSPGDARNALLIVAGLITTATYQAVLQPPGGLWQDDSGDINNNGNSTTANAITTHIAGRSILGTKNPVSYILFLIFNSLGFFASLQMIYSLTAKFPLQLELQIAMFALSGTYATAMGALTPTTFLNFFFVGISIGFPILLLIIRSFVRK